MQYFSNYATVASACELTLTDVKGEYSFSSANIIRMEAADNYTIIYFDKRKPFTVSKVLKIYEELLVPYGFVRTHRSHLINTRFIIKVDRTTIVMQDTSVIELSKRKRTRVMRQLWQLSTSK